MKCTRQFLGESHIKTLKHSKALCNKSKLHTSDYFQAFFKKSDQNFADKVTKAYLSADNPFYTLNNKHITNRFLQIVNLHLENTCTKMVLKLRRDKILRVETALNDKKFY